MDLIYSCSNTESTRVSHGVLGAVLVAHAGLLLALATYRNEIQLPVEQPIMARLVTQSSPKPDVAHKPLPVQSKPTKPVVWPAKHSVRPQAVAEPKDMEPQLVAKAADGASVSAPQPKIAASEVESVPLPSQESFKVADAPPKEEPIEQPRFNADYLDNPAPAYPSLSRKLREEGRVLLRVRVDAGGHPEQVTLLESSGFIRLDERAAETVRRWKFVPARQGGQPMDAWVIIPIQFSLKG